MEYTFSYLAAENSQDQDTGEEKIILLVSLATYIALAFWLTNYTPIALRPKLDQSNESVQNMQVFQKVNISNFSFLAAALMCKVICVSILLVQVMGLLNKESITYKWVRVLDSISFVFLLVACSLQLYKWIIIILRIQWFGSGQCDSD